MMKRSIIAAGFGGMLAAGFLASAPLANATNQGDWCGTWHATTYDPNGRIMTCVHTPTTGHIMYWEYGDMSHNQFDN